jgi:rubrerythrin
MLTPEEFVDNIHEENQAMFEASKMNVKEYFEGNLSDQEMVDHFVGRMVNERMNMSEIAQRVANAPDDMEPKELQLLTRQANDEARHFRMVKEVIEHISGEPVDVQAELARERQMNTAKGAVLLEELNCAEDEASLAAYQLVAEGRAEAVWDQMADTIEDEFISTRYRKIARDEGFHSSIGRWKLLQLATTQEVQDRISSLVEKIRYDMFEINCRNTKDTPAARQLVQEAYGW